MNFRFVDRIVSFDAEGSKIITAMTFPSSEDYLKGPLYSPSRIPFSITLEAMAQCAGALIIKAIGQDRVFPLLVRVDEAQFLAPVAPGEELLVQSNLLAVQDRSGESAGLAQTWSQASVGDRNIAIARMAFICVPLAFSQRIET